MVPRGQTRICTRADLGDLAWYKIPRRCRPNRSTETDSCSQIYSVPKWWQAQRARSTHSCPTVPSGSPRGGQGNARVTDVWAAVACTAPYAAVSNGVVTRCPLSTQVRAARRAVLRAMSATYPPVGQTLRPVFLDEAARHKPPRGDRWRAVRDVLSPGVHGKALTSCAHTKIKYEPSRYGAEREDQCLPIALCAVQEAVLLRCLRTLSRRPIPATFKATVPSRAH